MNQYAPENKKMLCYVEKMLCCRDNKDRRNVSVLFLLACPLCMSQEGLSSNITYHDFMINDSMARQRIKVVITPCKGAQVL